VAEVHLTNYCCRNNGGMIRVKEEAIQIAAIKRADFGNSRSLFRSSH
jgi:hypothetical protein